MVEFLLSIAGKDYKVYIHKLDSKTYSFELVVDGVTKTGTLHVLEWISAKRMLICLLQGRVVRLRIIAKEGMDRRKVLYLSGATIGSKINVTFPVQAQSILPAKVHHTPDEILERMISDEDYLLKAPLAGRVIRVLAQEGQSVRAHQPLVIIESMKMENEVCAPCDAIIKTISIEGGNLVQQNQVLITFERKGELDAASKNQYKQKAL